MVVSRWPSLISVDCSKRRNLIKFVILREAKDLLFAAQPISRATQYDYSNDQRLTTNDQLPNSQTTAPPPARRPATAERMHIPCRYMSPCHSAPPAARPSARLRPDHAIRATE